jgi:hypothetical protein
MVSTPSDSPQSSRPMPSVLAVMRASLAVLAFAAIGMQLALPVGASYSVLNFFSYFTNLSNLIAALVLLLCVFNASSINKRSMALARYVSVVNMTVVGLVFAVLLRDVDLGALLPWINFVLHYVMPVAVVADWLLNPPLLKLRSKDSLLALVFPSSYLAYVILRGAETGWYPYPFLNPANVGGYTGVAMYSLGIAITFLVAAGLLLAIGNRLAKAPTQDSGT